MTDVNIFMLIKITAIYRITRLFDRTSLSHVFLLPKAGGPVMSIGSSFSVSDTCSPNSIVDVKCIRYFLR
jgi:hypothetical protein